MAHAVSVPPVKATPSRAGCAVSAAPTVSPRPGSRCRRVGVEAGAVIEAHGLRGDQRRLLGGLGEHGVARGQRGGELAREDRQGEVPRAYADEHAAPVQLQSVVLADGAGEGGRSGEQALGGLGVVAQEVDRLAHLADGVTPALAGLAHGKRAKAVAFRLQGVRHAAQDLGAAGPAQGVPPRLRLAGEAEGVVHVGGRRLVGAADRQRAIGRIGHRLRRRRRARLAADQRRGDDPLAVERRKGVEQGVPLLRHGQVAASGITAPPLRRGAIEIERRRDARMAVGGGGEGGDGIAHHRLGRHAVVQKGVHEARVGPVLQQAPHEVGQEVLVPSHGCIGAQAERPVFGLRPRVERLAHAVQALELHRDAGGVGDPLHGRERLGVVRGELRIEVRRGGDHRLRADEVVHVGGGLGGPDRVVVRGRRPAPS